MWRRNEIKICSVSISQWANVTGAKLWELRQAPQCGAVPHACLPWRRIVAAGTVEIGTIVFLFLSYVFCPVSLCPCYFKFLFFISCDGHTISYYVLRRSLVILACVVKLEIWKNNLFNFQYCNIYNSYVFIFYKWILNHGTILMEIFYSRTFLACPVINQKCLLFTFVSNVNIVLVTMTN